MNRMLCVAGGLWVALMTTVGAHAQDNDAVKRQIERALRAQKQAVVVTDVRPSAMPGLVEVELNGQQQLYASADGRYLIDGTLLQLSDQGVRNLTEERDNAQRAQVLAGLDLAQTVTFRAEDQKAEVLVFTDPSCGYCQKLHQEIGDITSRGVTVHYMAFPRAGTGSEPARLLEQAWCAANPQVAVTQALLEQRVREPAAAEACQAPVAAQMELGQQLGVTGTPAIFALDGRQLGGYLPAAQLAAAVAP